MASMWLFSASADLCAFLGSALLSLLLLFVGAQQGLLASDSPEWVWVLGILLIDVAHVHSTLFRVYLDPVERKKRPYLYSLVPVFGFLVGLILYDVGALTFWRTLAYLAVYHFVRQQYGFLVLYRAKAQESSRWGYWVDTIAIYAATVYPLLYWHTTLPTPFVWFIQGDFAALPTWVEVLAFPVYCASILVYLLRAFWCGVVEKRWYWGKHVLLLTTVFCWYVGIVYFRSDYAFTVTNVFIHGIPYLVLIVWYGKKRFVDTGGENGPYFFWKYGVLLVIATIWLLAFAEEFLWDKTIWTERDWLFGAAWDVDDWQKILVPLLAIPQLTHYVLDAFIWKRSQNPEVEAGLR